MANRGNMSTHASNSSSSSHDRYTTTPEERSPPPGPLPPLPPPRTTAETIQDGFMIFAISVVEMRLRSVDQVKIMSTTLSHPRTVDQRFEGPLWGGKETLRFIILGFPEDLAHTSMELNKLFASELQKKTLRNDIRALYFHVLDFDFALIRDEILSRFTAANREHYNSQHMVVLITISPEFARTWNPTKLGHWVDWRDAEDAAGRGLSIQYRVSGSFTLDAAELEVLRNALHYHDLYGRRKGDMGKIMKCFKAYFIGEYQRLGI